MKRLCAVGVILSLAAGAGAQIFTVLKTFNPHINATGQHPVGTLVQEPDGMLYGVTTDGGAGGEKEPRTRFNRDYVHWEKW